MKLFACIGLLAAGAVAAEVHLRWEPPADTTGIACYNAWIGTNSGAYDYYVTVPGVTNCEVLYHLDVAKPYFFAVESVSSNGMIGALSEEVTIIPPATPRHLTIVIEQSGTIIPGNWIETTNIFDVTMDPQTNAYFRASIKTP